MSEGLLLFLILGPILVTVIGLGSVAILNYRHNPFWRMAQFRMLTVGQIKWSMLSPMTGNGHIIFVVKEIDKKKKQIISDTYIYKDGVYVLDIKDRCDTIASFFMFTDPEPKFAEEVTFE